MGAVVAQIAEGLGVAHGDGVTHRDLKPANVFVTKTEDGELLVKLLDFGIARMAQRIVKTKENAGRAPTRLTMKGLVLGSPAYMSPEQAMAESPDARADVWSLAVVAYEALAGVAPFHAKTADETIVRICGHAPTPLGEAMPGAAPELAAVFERAFARDIGRRFQTAPDFARALTDALPAAATGASPVAVTNVPPQLVETVAARSAHRGRVALLGVVGAGVLVAGAVLLGTRLLAARAPTAPAASATTAPPSVTAPPSAPPAVTTGARAVNVDDLPAVAPERTIRHAATAAPPANTRAPTATAPSASVDRSAVF